MREQKTGVENKGEQITTTTSTREQRRGRKRKKKRMKWMELQQREQIYEDDE